jgi:hypothetical protein
MCFSMFTKPWKMIRKIFDIVIDPGHLNKDLGYTDFGYRINDVVEANELLKMALLLKAEFEQYGLKVKLTREGDEIVNTYNIDGRLHRAYLSNAKYYIEVQAVGAGNSSVTGMQVVYSSFASPRLPSAVFRYLIDNTDLKSTGIRGTGSIPGVVPSGRADGFDGRMVIRESGGIALSAGNYSQKARDENYSFAGESRLGMHTVTIEYMYITHAPSVVQWNNQLKIMPGQRLKVMRIILIFSDCLKESGSLCYIRLVRVLSPLEAN